MRKYIPHLIVVLGLFVFLSTLGRLETYSKYDMHHAKQRLKTFVSMFHSANITNTTTTSYLRNGTYFDSIYDGSWRNSSHYIDFSALRSVFHFYETAVESANSTMVDTNTTPSVPIQSNSTMQVVRAALHPAVPTTSSSTSAPSQVANLTCRASFPTSCDMYPYVRFWKAHFNPHDCQRSALLAPRRLKTSPERLKYITFEPDRGGWNNIRMAAETVVVLALVTGRVLVVPPIMNWYLLDKVCLLLFEIIIVTVVMWYRIATVITSRPLTSTLIWIRYFDTCDCLFNDSDRWVSWYYINGNVSADNGLNRTSQNQASY